MTVYLSLEQVQELHRLQIGRFGGASGLRDRKALEAAVARPRATFGGEDLYPDAVSKAAALVHSLVMNPPFVDGNKRVGPLAGIVFLLINGVSPAFSAAELVEAVLAMARGEMQAEAFGIWLRQRTRPAEP